jgi:hypothetical protein
VNSRQRASTRHGWMSRTRGHATRRAADSSQPASAIRTVSVSPADAFVMLRHAYNALHSAHEKHSCLPFCLLVFSFEGKLTNAMHGLSQALRNHAAKQLAGR